MIENIFVNIMLIVGQVLTPQSPKDLSQRPTTSNVDCLPVVRMQLNDFQAGMACETTGPLSRRSDIFVFESNPRSYGLFWNVYTSARGGRPHTATVGEVGWMKNSNGWEFHIDLNP